MNGSIPEIQYCNGGEEQPAASVTSLFMIMSTTVPRLFALVIGINEYKELRPKLSGAVADANAMIKHLSSKTSASRILSLKDKQATRKSFIEAFKTLNRCKEIERNDPIVIYFAGHGAEAQIQLEGLEEMTQMILPYDASTRTQNKDELPVVPGIPDFEIRMLLNDIAVEKGNNIVRFFLPAGFLYSNGWNRRSYSTAAILDMEHAMNRKALVRNDELKYHLHFPESSTKEVPLFQSNTSERTSGLMYFSRLANPTRSPVSRVIMDLSGEISRLHCSNRSMKQAP